MRNALVVIYNEDFSRNVPILEEIYRHRFQKILYIVPDHFSRLESRYRAGSVSKKALILAERLAHLLRRSIGRRNQHELEVWPAEARVARVVGNKWFFQHFLWQARDEIKSLDADWYWFIGDDVLLSPGLNEATICEMLGVGPQTRSVICRPDRGSDEWIAKFQGSRARCLARFRELFSLELFGGAISDLREEALIGGCSDVFGIRRDLLEKALVAFRESAHRDLFVEIAVPNILKALDKNMVLIDEYDWDFDDDRGTLEKVERFWARPDCTFYHPCKLSRAEVASEVRRRYGQSSQHLGRAHSGERI